MYPRLSFQCTLLSCKQYSTCDRHHTFAILECFWIIAQATVRRRCFFIPFSADVLQQVFFLEVFLAIKQSKYIHYFTFSICCAFDNFMVIFLCFKDINKKTIRNSFFISLGISIVFTATAVSSLSFFQLSF